MSLISQIINSNGCKKKSTGYCYLKKIAGEASVEELESLRKFTSGNHEWTTMMENLQELWNSKPVSNNNAVKQKSEDAYLTHVNRLKEKAVDFEQDKAAIYNGELNIQHSPKLFYKRLLTYGIAAALFAGGLLIYSLPEEKKPVEKTVTESAVNEISVSKGTRSKIQLPDGSQVWLNSGSKLTYGKTFSGTNRELQLDGEAYFDVVKDVNHPFIVHTSGIDIKVLGTAFNVKAYEAEPTIEATLVHGSIEVIKKDQQNGSKIMLKPHEKLIYYRYSEPDNRDQRANITSSPVNDASSITIKPLQKNLADTDIVETAWIYNKLVFEDERFEDLAFRMEKWYNIKITIEGEKTEE